MNDGKINVQDKKGTELICNETQKKIRHTQDILNCLQIIEMTLFKLLNRM